MAMNRLTPSGGVSRAISLVITQKTPKNTGSMPTGLDDGQEDRREHDDGGQRLHEHAEEEQQCRDEQQDQDGIGGVQHHLGGELLRDLVHGQEPPENGGHAHDDEDGPGGDVRQLHGVEHFLQGKLLGDEEADEKGVPHCDDRGFHGACICPRRCRRG